MNVLVLIQTFFTQLKRLHNLEGVRNGFLKIYESDLPQIGVDLEGTILAMNHAAERLTGHKEFFLVGETLATLLHRPYVPGKPVEFRIRAGRTAQSWASFEPQRDLFGRVIGYRIDFRAC